ncbi:heavy metal translocating P-type ATPase [Clostridium coskatii]|uniref:Cadmium, zinc and cobalt-transporting ATPase n=1 Tax=Clostridium coskatii TaxID=1705578 RepID=A0A166TIX3_9CLOT|nr:heavy metal translocating P-type ATPase [Clostridium coskatii]OAA93743.1 Cadmium, zinc and cobalt-transporting ATPase [Clostridium coskatii]OBR96033.1 cadmium, zinc and cobalt-transporting ATPase [Clostridium coskatii]
MNNTMEVKLQDNRKLKNKYIKKEFILQGLDCAHCAAKIENKINEIPEIKNASVDFLSKKLKFELYDEKKFNNTVENIKSIVKRLEPDVKVIYEGNEKSRKVEEPKEKSKKIGDIISIVGILIYITGIIFKFSFQVELTLFLFSYIAIGKDVLWKAVKNISHGQLFDENFLMCIASIGAFTIGQFPEAVAVMLFYKIGEYFQDRAVNNSRKSIADLMDIKPEFANVKTKSGLKKMKPEDVNIGELILVKPGEKIPLDGEIIEGKSMVDTSALTGESLPKEVGREDVVLGGYINENGVLTLKVTKSFKESTVSKILDLVENASSKKAPTENFITKFARYYTPAVVAFAIGLALLPPLMGGESFSKWIYRALVFLVVSCPCALVISVPLGFFGGIGAASKNGILVKGGNYLEALNSIDTVVFDKTGTLTKGIFKVTQVKAFNGFTDEDVLKYAAFVESYSNHPIALSIVKQYNQDIDRNLIKDYAEISGEGIKAAIDGREIIAGNTRLMEKEKINYDISEVIGTVIHVALDKIYMGYIVISDEVKEDSKDTIRMLKDIGIKKTVMLTGDNKKIGEAIGYKLGLDEVHAQLLPDQKVEKLNDIITEKSSNRKMIFVGDGINDAPVLARADVGIAMGGIGSDAAIEAADVVIMTDEPSKIVTAIKIAKRTKKIVSQNIVFALGVKLVILVLGAVGIANMWEAVFGDVGVALIAVLNSMRAMKVEKAKC